MTHHPDHRLPDGRRITRGDEATVHLPGRSTRTRARFLWADTTGALTFADPRNGGARTITPDRVSTIHRTRKTRT